MSCVYGLCVMYFSIYAIQPSLVHCDRLTDTRFFWLVHKNTKKGRLICNSAIQFKFFSSGDNIILLFQYPQHIRIDITEHMDILPARRNWIPNKGMEYHPGLTERELPPAELDMGPTLSRSVTLRHDSGEGTEALRWILLVRAPSSRTSFSTIDIPGRWRTSEARQGPSRGQTIAAEGESQCTALLLISSIPLEYTFHYTPNAMFYY